MRVVLWSTKTESQETRAKILLQLVLICDECLTWLCDFIAPLRCKRKTTLSTRNKRAQLEIASPPVTSRLPYRKRVVEKRL